MMLDAIFDGTFNPSELRIQNSEKFTQACKNAERLQMQLSMQLCDEDYALVEDLTNELLNSCEAECRQYFDAEILEAFMKMQIIRRVVCRAYHLNS